MKEYIKPTCETVKVDVESSIMAASEVHQETGDGKWLAPRHPDTWNEEDGEE